MLFVCTAHIHWDPEYCDVKVIQTLMLLSELKTIMEDAIQKYRTNSNPPMDCTSVPLVLCGDFNFFNLNQVDWRGMDRGNALDSFL